MTYNSKSWECDVISIQMGGCNSLQPVDWYIVWCHIRSLKKLIVFGCGFSPARQGLFLLDYIFTPWLSFKTIRENAPGSETAGALGGRVFTGCKSMAICFWIRPWHISVCNSVWRSLGHLCSYCKVSAIMRPGGSGNRMSRWMNHCICLALFSVYMPKVLHM